VETLTGKVVSNIDQRLRDHEFQNKKEVVLSLDASLRLRAAADNTRSLCTKNWGIPGGKAGDRTLYKEAEKWRKGRLRAFGEKLLVIRRRRGERGWSRGVLPAASGAAYQQQ